MLMPKIWIICRVCLKQQEDMHNIFDETENIWEILRDCGGVPVKKSDDFPDKICEACLGRLWDSRNFRIDCQESHHALTLKFMTSTPSITNSSVVIEKSEETNSASDMDKNIVALINENNVKIKKNSRTIQENGHSSDTNIKQYCVVTKNEEKGTNFEEINETSAAKEPIILLLRLKPIDIKNDDTEIIKTDAETKKAFTVEANKYETTKTNESEKFNTKTNTNTEQECNTKKQIRSKVNREEGSTCEVCNKTYRTNDLLRHHMYTHKKPHQCKICLQRFSQSHSLNSHHNLHTGIKMYYCRICYQTFSNRVNRNAHERRRHKNRKFRCLKCNKIFRLVSLLNRHAQSHRPKKCFICNKEFSSLQIVRNHHQRKHLLPFL